MPSHLMVTRKPGTFSLTDAFTDAVLLQFRVFTEVNRLIFQPLPLALMGLCGNKHPRSMVNEKKDGNIPSFDDLVNPSHEGDSNSARAKVDANGWADGGNETSFGLYHGFRICQ